MSISVQDHLGNEYPSINKMLEHYGISKSNYRYRYLSAGWSLEKTLTTPVRNKRQDREKRFHDRAVYRVPKLSYESESIFDFPMGIFLKDYVVKGRYPGEEYLNLLNKIKKVVMDFIRVTDKEFVISEISFKINRKELEKSYALADKLIILCSNQSFHLRFCDLLYAGEEERVRSAVDEETLYELKRSLEEPEGLFKDIYVNFAGHYKIPKHL